MKMDVLVTDGSPVGVCSECVWGDDYRVGVGGSELALLTMCEEWTKAGHDLCLYNSPHKANIFIDQRNKEYFNPNEDRDVLIVFRSPNSKAIGAKGLKIWWSCDQYTIGSFADFAPMMDKIVCISPYHLEYFKNIYGIENAVYIDLAVRLNDFPIIGKVPGRIIFTSVPDRGLQNLWRMYPAIKSAAPHASLVITSDYRLWGAGAMNEKHRSMWFPQSVSDVRFVGAIPRKQYLWELMQAELMIYPCNYEELFCISVAEAECAGVYPITSDCGALRTTTIGTIVFGDATKTEKDREFIWLATEMLNNPDQAVIERQRIREEAIKRFSPEYILWQWNERIFK